MKTIIFTGGHHNSALEIAKILKKKYQIIWVGHKHTIRGDTSLSYEFQEVTKSKIPFIELGAGKFYRPESYSEWLKIPQGFVQAWQIVSKYKPDLIVSFGSYLSAPVVLAGFLKGIPSVCHEQTTYAGMANRFNARLAKKVFITWPETYRFFPIQKTVFTGLPLRRTIFTKKLSPLHDFHNQLPTLFITGGKQGSHAINLTVGKIYPALLSQYNIIHQTGGLRKTRDFDRMTAISKKLSSRYQKRLFLTKYLFQMQMCQATRQADLVVCRAGAHTVYELVSLGKPSLFIPLKRSISKEQYQNAQKAKDLGMAEILFQDKMNAQTLLTTINEMMAKLKHYHKAGNKAKKSVKKDAAQSIVDEINKIL